ncbi:uncharacterized protein LOC125247904 isoform X2 [Megalobrama amblycephala]|uniref:uncharacterized protein LOC125247904 isoform X2 n=1 Tax=Megalobrama amblycephala TaxID=75352 RepID=UPI002013CBDF|nr:uncharacterized protein LOC125247904 isoform X2 [Megalobrama amblycephala]
MEDVKVLRCLQNKRPTFTVGSVGPYKIQVESFSTLMNDSEVSDEVMDSICNVLSKDRPSVVHINSQALTKILDGSKRAKSHYFLKNNILEKATEVFGVYLEGGNHWSFFHCNVDERCITYFNSLGETEWQCQKIAQHWCAFAASRGVKGEWDLKTTRHELQTDSVSCGIHTLACPAIQEERMRLASLLFHSLDRTKTCGICTKSAAGRKKVACNCGAVLHVECAATPMCYICQDDSIPLAQISLPAPDTAPHLADPDQVVQPSGSAEGFALQHEETVLSMLEAIGKPMACCSEEELEEDKEEEKHEHNEEKHREDKGVEEKESKVYKVLGRLTAQGKTYKVDEDELRRRVKGENMSTNMFRMLIRVGKKDVPPNVLQQPRKAKTKVTIFSTLTEGEAEDIAKGFGMALAKHVPKEKLLSGIPQEDIPATLRSIERMKINVQNLGPESELDLATHRFGPTAADVFFSFLEDCLK